MCWVGAAIAFAYLAVDHVYVDGAALTAARIARVFIICPLCVFWAIAIRHARKASTLNTLMPYTMTPIGVSFHVIYALSTEEAGLLWAGIALAQVGLFATSLFRWAAKAFLSITIVLLLPFVVLVALRSPPFSVWSLAIFTSGSIVLLSAFFAYRMEVNDRRAFLTERELQAVKVREEKRREAEIRWYQSFAKFLNHELRNSLLGISTSLKLAQSKRSEENKKYVDRAAYATGLMKVILDQASDATSLESALASDQSESVNVYELLYENAAEWSVVLAYPINVSGRQDAFVQATPERLLQMFEKVVTNAVEHTDSAHPVEVLISVDSQHFVQIDVVNIGRPLPEDTSTLFRAFHTTKRSATNCGLGLYVARVIAESLGGSISAASYQETRGACFRFRFPPVKADAHSDRV